MLTGNARHACCLSVAATCQNQEFATARSRWLQPPATYDQMPWHQIINRQRLAPALASLS